MRWKQKGKRNAQDKPLTDSSFSAWSISWSIDLNIKPGSRAQTSNKKIVPRYNHYKLVYRSNGAAGHSTVIMRGTGAKPTRPCALLPKYLKTWNGRIFGSTERNTLNKWCSPFSSEANPRQLLTRWLPEVTRSWCMRIFSVTSSVVDINHGVINKVRLTLTLWTNMAARRAT